MDRDTATTLLGIIRDESAGLSGRHRHRGQRLALAALGPSWGIVYCGEVSHINTSEANATGFFGGGIKLAAIGGEYGKIDAGLFAEALGGILPGQLHRGQPIAVSLTEATDLGQLLRSTIGRSPRCPRAAA